MRSLRTTGCRARIIVLAPLRIVDDLSRSEQAIFRTCGAQLISYGDASTLWWEPAYILRFALFFDFLHSHAKEFDRVFLVELSDVVFQRDPFTSDIAAESIYFVEEGVDLDGSDLEKKEFQKLGVRFSEFRSRALVTNSIFGGGIEPVLVFLDMYYTYYRFTYSDYPASSELAYFLYCYYSFATNSRRLKARTLKGTSGFLAFRYLQSPTGDFRPGFVKDPTNTTIAIAAIHIDENVDFLYSYYDACPRGKMRPPVYLRGVPVAYMEGKIDRHGKPIEDDDDNDAEE
jgi:hypothetical protein